MIKRISFLINNEILKNIIVDILQGYENFLKIFC